MQADWEYAILVEEKSRWAVKQMTGLPRTIGYHRSGRKESRETMLAGRTVDGGTESDNLRTSRQGINVRFGMQIRQRSGAGREFINGIEGRTSLATGKLKAGEG